MKNFKAIAAMLLLSISSTITFTSCQDDTLDDNKQKTAPESAQKALMEAYGLTFENFVTPNDVQILNADTTEISVNKALAEKLGITSFVNHPLGIWDAKNHMPYARKATAERLIGDRYILTVGSTTVAELIGNKKVTLNTSVYVNPNVTGNKTRAGIDMPSYAAKYMDENDVIHPAVILYTDPYGYDKEYHTLNGGCKWKAIFPSFYVEKFEAGLDGEFAFSPEFTVGVSDELELDKDKYKWPIVKFPSYSFTATAERQSGVSMYISQSPTTGKHATYQSDLKKLAWYYAVWQ